MKKIDAKKRFIAVASLIVVMCMAVGILTAFPAVSVIEVGASEENIYAPAADYVVLTAEDMEGRISGDNQTKYGFGNVDGVKCLRLQAKKPEDKVYDVYVTYTPEKTYSADDYKYVSIIVKSSVYQSTRFSLFYNLNKSGYSGQTTIGAAYAATTGWQVITFDLSERANWYGDITSVRFDYYEGDSAVSNGEVASIAAMILSRTPEDVYESANEFLTANFFKAEQTLSDFSESELKYFERAQGNASNGNPWLASLDTVLSLKGSNLLYTYKYDSSVAHSGPDPYAGFFYKELVAARKIDRLTTADFRYTIIRYRTTGDVGNSSMHLYQFTGDMYEPNWIDGKEMAPHISYTASTANQWRALVVDMASGDYAKGWQGDFNGFRIDWCAPSSKSSSATMEISDIMFFKDGATANAYATALNTIHLAVPDDNEDAAEDTYKNPVTVSSDTRLLLPDALEGMFVKTSDTKFYVTNSKGNKALRLETTKEVASPSIKFNPGSISADEYKYITLMVRTAMTSGAALELSYNTSKSKNSDHNYYVARYEATSEWQRVTIPLDEVEGWGGNVIGLTFKYLSYDPVYTGYAAGATVDIGGIAFSKTPDAFYDAVYYFAAQIYRPVGVVGNFTEADRNVFTQSNTSDTKVSFVNGDIRFDSFDKMRDPFVPFHYKVYMENRGVPQEEWLTTEDFNTVVFRYKTSDRLKAPGMQLFLYTDQRYQADGKITVSKSYTATRKGEWKSLIQVMTANDAAREAWQGDFNGFRIDWCGNCYVGDYVELSEFFFFANTDVATKFSDAVSKVTIPTRDSGEYNDEYANPVPVSKDFTVITPDKIAESVTDSSNSIAYLAKNGGVDVLRIENISATENPYVTYSPENISADEYDYVMLLVKSDKAYGALYTMNYTTDKSKSISRQYVSANYSTSADWQFVTVNLSGKDSWSGIVDELRLGYLYTGMKITEGVTLDIGAIVFCKNDEAVFDAAYSLASEIYRPIQTMTDFSEDDTAYLGGEGVQGNTTVSFDNGNAIFTATAPDGNTEATTVADPQRMINYLGFAASRGLKPVTTDVFQYTVIRYRTKNVSSADTEIELFILTGDAKTLSDMIRIEGTANCHSGYVKYQTANNWRSVVVNMAEDDGYHDNNALKYGWNREDGNTTFKGFRFDWCMKGTVGSYMEVSDFIFFASAADADCFSDMINTVNIPLATSDNPGGDPGDDWPFDDPTTETDEQVPEFSNPEDETVPVEDSRPEEDSSVIDTDIREEESTYLDESEKGEESESETEKEVVTTPIIVPGTENESNDPSGGSQAPFYIVCACLALLTFASLVCSLVIRIKTGKEKTPADEDVCEDEDK